MIGDDRILMMEINRRIREVMDVFGGEDAAWDAWAIGWVSGGDRSATSWCSMVNHVEEAVTVAPAVAGFVVGTSAALSRRIATLMVTAILAPKHGIPLDGNHDREVRRMLWELPRHLANGRANRDR